MCIDCIKKRIKENTFALQNLKPSDVGYLSLASRIKADKELLNQAVTGIKNKCCE